MSSDDLNLTVPPPAPDSLVDGHAELTPIGRGGSAEVYRATELAFERSVAIKVFSTRLRGDEDVREFRRECLAIGRVGSHPNIVRVFTAGRTRDGRPYLSMELMEGSYADSLPRTGLPPGQVLRAGIALAGAVATAHHAGVLHRDIKPENILRSRFGDVALADFGVASVMAHTTESALGVTLRHAAPEVLAGEHATEQSDVYSLASTLFELLTGAAPFDGPDSRAAMRKVVADPPPLPGRHVPQGMGEALLGALSRDAAARPATMADFGRQLEAVADRTGMVGASMVLLDTDVSVRPDGAPASGQEPRVRPPTPRPRRPALLVGIAGTLAALVVAAALTLGPGTEPNSASPSTSSSVSTLPESPEALIQLLDQQIARQTPAGLDVGRACLSSRLSLLNPNALTELLTLGPGTGDNVSAMANSLEDCLPDRSAVATAMLSGGLGAASATPGVPLDCVQQGLVADEALTPLAVQLLAAAPESPVVDRLAAERVAIVSTECMSEAQLVDMVTTEASTNSSIDVNARAVVLACAPTVIPQMDDINRGELAVLAMQPDGLTQTLQDALVEARADVITSIVATAGGPVTVSRTEDGQVSGPDLVCKGSPEDMCSASRTDSPDGTDPTPQVC